MGGGFHGAAVITLDAKGRVAIPTRHRDALLDGGKSLVVTAHPDCCVLIYPASEWEPVRLRVEAFPSFHPQASWWKRLLLGFEEHLTPTARAGSFFRRPCESTPSSIAIRRLRPRHASCATSASCSSSTTSGR